MPQFLVSKAMHWVRNDRQNENPSHPMLMKVRRELKI
jgi:hypothetical protein